MPAPSRLDSSQRAKAWEKHSRPFGHWADFLVLGLLTTLELASETAGLDDSDDFRHRLMDFCRRQ